MERTGRRKGTLVRTAIKEFEARREIREVVEEEANKLQALVDEIGELSSRGRVPSPKQKPSLAQESYTEATDKDRAKVTCMVVDLPANEFFTYPFRVLEKHFTTEPDFAQLNGDARCLWSICFDQKIGDNDEETKLFPCFFEFIRLTSGECIIRYNSQTGGECAFESRQLTNPQELEEQFKSSHNALADLGINLFLLYDRQLLPSALML